MSWQSLLLSSVPLLSGEAKVSCLETKKHTSRMERHENPASMRSYRSPCFPAPLRPPVTGNDIIAAPIQNPALHIY